MRSISLLVSMLFALASCNLSRGAASPTAPQKRAIVRSLSQELNHATSGHIKIGAWKLTSLDVQNRWALAEVEPTGKPQLDSFMTLLHQVRGVWKVMTLGTNLRSSGKKFGAPRRLWKKWNL